jgi:2-oxoglutarate ferredoxin oxidoreductase subunit alpha
VTEAAEIVCLGFGSTRNVIKEACDALADKKIGVVHLPQVWPFPVQQLQNLLGDRKRVITIENNAGAQLAGLLRRETGITAENSILRYDGRPFSVDSLIDSIKERI